MRAIRTHLITGLLVAGLALAAGCGADDAPERAAAPAAAEPGLDAIKQYLLDHTAALQGSTGRLAEQGQEYYALAEAADFDYARLLAERREDVERSVGAMQKTWQEANPQYEEAEGVVAGVPELSEFDVIIDAGADKSDPENAVPFDVKLPGGKVLKQPGNFFFLTETSLFGTTEAFQAKGVKPDLDGDGSVSFGEAVPDAALVMAVTRDFAAQARDLHASARRWQPSRQDALQALVTMTPTMSEYFGQWKTSRFIAGSKADEASFAASSRLQDIEDILTGLVTIYGNVDQAVAEVDADQAEQTGRELRGLRDFAADLRRKEDGGTRFTAEQADTLGAEAQGRAEAIAGQVSQAAAQLGIELES
jgi:hypothetical protein